MTKGKYASAAQAREVREAAVRDAEQAKRRLELAEAENVELRAQVEQLRTDLAAGTTAKVVHAQQRATAAEADARAARALLAEVRDAMKDTYEGTVRGLVKMGIPIDLACDRVDEVTTFFVGDELLPYTEVVTEVDPSRIKLHRVRKRNAAERKIAEGAVNRVAKIKDTAAHGRFQQGVNP